MKKITTTQIEQLFAFTRQHYVEHYDLQCELVDHLANGIEQQWERIPAMHFDEALQVEFKKFGVFGFMDVVDKKQRAMEKRYLKIIWQHMLSFFKSARVLVLILTVALLYQFVTTVSYASQIIYWFCLVYLVLYFVLTLNRTYRLKKKRQQSGNKTWLFEEQLHNYGMWSSLSFIPYYTLVSTLRYDSNLNDLPLPLLLAVLTFLVLVACLCYIMYVEIPAKATQYLKETYPEYKLVSND